MRGCSTSPGFLTGSGTANRSNWGVHRCPRSRCHLRCQHLSTEQKTTKDEASDQVLWNPENNQELSLHTLPHKHAFHRFWKLQTLLNQWLAKNSINSKTCLRRLPHSARKSGLCRQVVSFTSLPPPPPPRHTDVSIALWTVANVVVRTCMIDETTRHTTGSLGWCDCQFHGEIQSSYNYSFQIRFSSLGIELCEWRRKITGILWKSKSCRSDASGGLTQWFSHWYTSCIGACFVASGNVAPIPRFFMLVVPKTGQIWPLLHKSGGR